MLLKNQFKVFKEHFASLPAYAQMREVELLKDDVSALSSLYHLAKDDMIRFKIADSIKSRKLATRLINTTQYASVKDRAAQIIKGA